MLGPPLRPPFPFPGPEALVTGSLLPRHPVCDLPHSRRRRETRRRANSAGRLDLTLTRPEHPGLSFLGLDSSFI